MPTSSRIRSPRFEVALSSAEDRGWREAAVVAVEELDRLAAFITTTLDVAEAEGGGLRIRREIVNVAELVARLVALYEPAFSDRQQELQTRLPDSVAVRGDASLIRRALANLLDNELRHAGPGTKVGVVMAVESDSVSLQIEDDGVGFPSEVLARIFQRFAKTATSDGHGLGLAFVRAVARAHGGNVAVGNRADGGRVRPGHPAGR